MILDALGDRDGAREATAATRVSARIADYGRPADSGMIQECDIVAKRRADGRFNIWQVVVDGDQLLAGLVPRRCSYNCSTMSLGIMTAADAAASVGASAAKIAASASRWTSVAASSRGCRRRYTRNSHVDRANPTIDPTKNPATTPMTRPPVMRLVRLGAHHRPRLSMLQRQERPVNTRARAGRRRARVTASLPRRRRPRRTSAFPRPTGPPRHASRIGRAS
jgi:hypothetical protein